MFSNNNVIDIISRNSLNMNYLHFLFHSEEFEWINKKNTLEILVSKSENLMNEKFYIQSIFRIINTKSQTYTKDSKFDWTTLFSIKILYFFIIF